MASGWLFLIVLGSVLVAELTVFTYLVPGLERLLVELFGTDERADFWTTFSSLTLVLVPTVFAVHAAGDPGAPVSLVVQTASQLKWGLAGLAASVIMLGWVTGKFVPPQPVRNVVSPFGNTSANGT